MKPTASASYSFRPSNSLGLLHTAATVLLTAAGFVVSQSPGTAWIFGQALLGVALVQWFIVLHECGHETMFRSAALNRATGHLASFFSLIPFHCWKPVHASHHRWTGWQDLDPTTASLVPRRLGAAERFLINVSWRYWIPVFSLIYRLNNYWNMTRLRRLYGPRHSSRMTANATLLLLLYATIIYAAGPMRVIQYTALSLFFAFVIEDLLILSQHTHIPQQVSRGLNVRPFAASEQEAFTRSLRFPGWLSRSVLLSFDAHELHHMYPFVPGYHLRRIAYRGANEVHWWTWITTVKRIPGEQFLFQNQNDSGIRI